MNRADYQIGKADGIEAAAKWHDAQVVKWTKEAQRHYRPNGRRSDCFNRDAARAAEHARCAAAIRLLSQGEPS